MFNPKKTILYFFLLLFLIPAFSQNILPTPPGVDSMLYQQNKDDPQKDFKEVDKNEGFEEQKLNEEAESDYENEIEKKTTDDSRTNYFRKLVKQSFGYSMLRFGEDFFENSNMELNFVTSFQTPDDYLISPGDILNLSVWGQLEMNEKLTC